MHCFMRIDKGKLLCCTVLHAVSVLINIDAGETSFVLVD